jgi:hypothetical protein
VRERELHCHPNVMPAIYHSMQIQPSTIKIQ